MNKLSTTNNSSSLFGFMNQHNRRLAFLHSGICLWRHQIVSYFLLLQRSRLFMYSDRRELLAFYGTVASLYYHRRDFYRRYFADAFSEKMTPTNFIYDTKRFVPYLVSLKYLKPRCIQPFSELFS